MTPLQDGGYAKSPGASSSVYLGHIITVFVNHTVAVDGKMLTLDGKPVVCITYGAAWNMGKNKVERLIQESGHASN
jgi:hypothetical protein